MKPTDLNEKIKTLDRIIDELKSDNYLLDQKLGDYEDIVDQQKERIKHLEKQIEHLNNQCEYYEEELASVKKEKHNLEKQLQNYEELIYIQRTN